ncbi:cytochrome c oxidase assembly factor 5 [Ixodes scapularis]|uniref:cytochrome c oxidase assembly factor 5 n=1 Tax=Ixodes scapularis TaxID=6945 RepID=UPI0011617300|nr:cytochrome c oxidase assembly factor 5 [Ixodes scapularis]
MPLYTEENSAFRVHSSCEGVRDDLKRCLLATDCVKLDGLSPKKCILTSHPSVPQECHNLKNLLFECKRSLLDNRQRFRGRKGY